MLTAHLLVFYPHNLSIDEVYAARTRRSPDFLSHKIVKDPVGTDGN